MTAAERLLERLDGVRRTGQHQWLARCPSHDDRSPSLSVRELEDRVLVNCFAGCDAHVVMVAVNLTLADLYKRPLNHVGSPVHRSRRWDFRALLRLLRTEAGVVLIAANDLERGCALCSQDHERLRNAIARICRVVEVAS